MRRVLAAVKFSDHHAAFGAHLRRLREARKWTQEQLADEAELGRATIQFLEYGTKSATLDTLLALSRALQLPLLELLRIEGLTDQPLPKP